MKHVDPSDRFSESQDEELREVGLKTLKAGRAFFIASLIVLLGVIIYYTTIVMNILSIPIGIVLWTVVIVFCLRGIVDGLEKRGVKRMFGTAIAYVIMFLVLAGCVLLVFSPLFGVGNQFDALVQSVPHYINEVRDWSNNIYNEYSEFFQDETIREYVDSAFSSLASWASGFASQSAQGVAAFGSGVANTLLVVGFALVVAFWILLELPQIAKEIFRIAGAKRKEDVLMLEITFTRVVGGYIKATIIQCGIIGIACGVGFAVMGIPNAAALGLIAGILNIIPVIGPWLGGALAAITGIFVSPLIAIIALVYTIIIQQVVYTFISPKLMSNSVDIHPALVILALMAGSALGFAMSGFLGSFIGMLLAIPLTAAAKSIFVYYFEKRTGRPILSPDGVFLKGPSDGGKVNPLADATGEMPPVTADQLDQ
ncbi:AI-2E family transporter [Anaerotardibacter muris]|uniref:AI-2E family transporter n=1 Tax=Anaerotardibacter muris TaxID=2941505 RepID=UPI0020402351|nr:AI-2E family transporter [Anaerotardibacter muris]